MKDAIVELKDADLGLQRTTTVMMDTKAVSGLLKNAIVPVKTPNLLKSEDFSFQCDRAMYRIGATYSLGTFFVTNYRVIMQMYGKKDDSGKEIVRTLLKD
jgi:hypothetical protein